VKFAIAVGVVIRLVEELVVEVVVPDIVVSTVVPFASDVMAISVEVCALSAAILKSNWNSSLHHIS